MGVGEGEVDVVNEWHKSVILGWWTRSPIAHQISQKKDVVSQDEEFKVMAVNGKSPGPETVPMDGVRQVAGNQLSRTLPEQSMIYTGRQPGFTQVKR
jgi:hypothetical protein